MEGEDEQDIYDQSFIDQPAILDKYKAAAVVAEGKQKISNGKKHYSRDLKNHMISDDYEVFFRSKFLVSKF